MGERYGKEYIFRKSGPHVCAFLVSLHAHLDSALSVLLLEGPSFEVLVGSRFG